MVRNGVQVFSTHLGEVWDYASQSCNHGTVLFV